MKISHRRQITIPKYLRERFGLDADAEVGITATPEGLLVRKRSAMIHPVDRAYAVLGEGGDIDEYLEEIRGR